MLRLSIMRDPERIKRIVVLLQKAWELNPDWRLGQLVSNLQGPGRQDVFHTEDDQWEKKLQGFIREHEELKEQGEDPANLM